MTLNQRLATRTYANIGIQTRTPQHDPYELALLMFEAVMAHTAGARGAIEVGDVPTKALHLHKAVRVLQDGLRTSLDLDNGGELAQNLAHLYDYCILRLTQANAQNDARAVAEVTDLIRPVADAWRSMRSSPQGPGAAAVPAGHDVQTQAPTQAPPAARRMAGSLYSPVMALSGA